VSGVMGGLSGNLQRCNPRLEVGEGWRFDNFGYCSSSIFSAKRQL
jgi:hypothetical protein